VIQVFLTVGEAARALGVSPDTVRLYERHGKLRAERTAGGLRLFSPADVEALRRERELGGANSRRAVTR
jgi:excisionase family DNA binding protein